MTNIILDPRQLCDLDLLLNGSFAPVHTFMNEKDYHSVLENMHLTSGEVFPLPITLCTNNDIDIGSTLNLVDEHNYPIAYLEVNEVYSPDVEKECNSVYGCCDDNHPYIKRILQNKDSHYISGKLTKINGVHHFDYPELRRTPEEVRNLFKKKGWNKVVAFQTRNPMHRSHMELTLSALKEAGEGTKLLIHPVVGVTQECDVDYHTRVNCYKKLLKYYPEDSVELSLLNLSMRMAGPKEAILHGIVRKNHGCTHLIVGRDHAGPSYKKKDGSNFFGPYDAQDLFIKHSDEIGIKLIKFKMISYIENLDTYLPADKITDDMVVKNISGTQQREMLRNGEKIPEWFTFPDIADELKKKFDYEREQGLCIYLVGLSGSGKTTIANHLKNRLLEKDYTKNITILDGDVVRQNLSKGLGFSRADRSTNVRRIGYVASEIVKHKGIVICANIAPYDNDRRFNRELIEKYGKYVEVMVGTSLETCEDRDIKGLYKLAREGKIKEFTGISNPFEDSSQLDVMISGTNLDDDIHKIMGCI
jgi:sulfate adenylyltransferase